MRKVLRASSESAFDARWNKVRATSERPLGSEVYWGSRNFGPREENQETVTLHRKDNSFRILSEVTIGDSVKCGECQHLGKSHFAQDGRCVECIECPGFEDTGSFMEEITGYHYYLMHYYGIE